VKTIKGDLVLKKDMKFKDSITVEGNIRCEGERWSLVVAGNIVARNINAWDIDARNIVAGNIDAGNIDAWNMIFCEKVKVKQKIKARSVIRNRSKLEQNIELALRDMSDKLYNLTSDILIIGVICCLFWIILPLYYYCKYLEKRGVKSDC